MRFRRSIDRAPQAGRDRPCRLLGTKVRFLLRVFAYRSVLFSATTQATRGARRRCCRRSSNSLQAPRRPFGQFAAVARLKASWTVAGASIGNCMSASHEQLNIAECGVAIDDVDPLQLDLERACKPSGVPERFSTGRPERAVGRRPGGSRSHSCCPYAGCSAEGRYGQSDFRSKVFFAASHCSGVRNIPPRSFPPLIA